MTRFRLPALRPFALSVVVLAVGLAVVGLFGGMSTWAIVGLLIVGAGFVLVYIYGQRVVGDLQNPENTARGSRPRPRRGKD